MMVTACATLLVLLPAAGGQKAAMVLAVTGSVTYQTQEGATRSARIMDLLADGDRLTTGDDGAATLIFLGDKHRERVSPGSQVTIAIEGCVPASAVKRQAAIDPNTAVRYEDVERLAGSGKAAAGTLRDPRLPEVPPRVTPLFGAAVLNGCPTLSWRAANRATEYHVRLVTGRLDTAASQQKIVWTAATQEPTLSYPEKEKPLMFGRVYSWYVTALINGTEQAVCQSQFSVTTRAEAAELARIKPLASSKDPAELLLAALTYQEHGVYREALALFERLAEQAPREARYQAALADYYERAGYQDKAQKALERAKKLGFIVPRD